MEHALAELPLALFTTIGAVGVGSFIYLCLAIFTHSFGEEGLKRLDKFTLVPLVLLIVATICAFFHLSQPLHAPFILLHILSPMTIEILVFGVVVGLIVVYLLLAKFNKLPAVLRKVLIALIALGTIAVGIFMGLAYKVSTIPVWAAPHTPIMMVGFVLAGGTSLGLLVLKLAKLEPLSQGFKLATVIVMLIGLALSAYGVFSLYTMAQGITTHIANGAEMAAEMFPCVVVFGICIALSAILNLIALFKNSNVALLSVSVILALVGIFAARLVFYGLQISIAL